MERLEDTMAHVREMRMRRVCMLLTEDELTALLISAVPTQFANGNLKFSAITPKNGSYQLEFFESSDAEV